MTLASKTSIEWTAGADGTPGSSWTPIRARNRETGRAGWYCTHASDGCRNCYAERINRRLGTGIDYRVQDAGKVELYLDEALLRQPMLRWRRPRRVFVCSMTDLLGDFVTDEMIDRVFAVMALCQQHTFLVLTKRAERMRDYLGRLAGDWTVRLPDANPPGSLSITKNDVERHLGRLPKLSYDPPTPTWPLPNVWCGVSCEDQNTADERIPHLLATPAAVRWISAEPMIGPVDLWNLRDGTFDALTGCGDRERLDEWEPTPTLNWVVVGGESGAGARPFDLKWARSIIAQCRAAGVRVFMKQIGSMPYSAADDWPGYPRRDKGGDMTEWPADLRVREYPNV